MWGILLRARRVNNRSTKRGKQRRPAGHCPTQHDPRDKRASLKPVWRARVVSGRFCTAALMLADRGNQSVSGVGFVDNRHAGMRVGKTGVLAVA